MSMLKSIWLEVSWEKQLGSYGMGATGRYFQFYGFCGMGSKNSG
jgi:hypothetical protein